MATTQPIRDKKQVRKLAEYYLHKGELRNYVLVILGIHTALRIGDLLRLKWDDIYDFEKGRVRQAVHLVEQKTGKSKTVALSKTVVGALALYAGSACAKGRFLLENPGTHKPISRVQAYRLIRTACEALGFDARVSCHSLRKTFGYHAWVSGASPAILMDIYNHSSMAVTQRYLGISQDDKDAVYMGLDVCN